MDRILIVRDDPVIAESVAWLMQLWGLEARCVTVFQALLQRSNVFPDPDPVLAHRGACFLPVTVP